MEKDENLKRCCFGHHGKCQLVASYSGERWQSELLMSAWTFKRPSRSTTRVGDFQQSNRVLTAVWHGNTRSQRAWGQENKDTLRKNLLQMQRVSAACKQLGKLNALPSIASYSSPLHWIPLPSNAFSYVYIGLLRTKSLHYMLLLGREALKELRPWLNKVIWLPIRSQWVAAISLFRREAVVLELIFSAE